MRKVALVLSLFTSGAGAIAAPVSPTDDLPPMVRKAKNFDRSLLAPVDGITLRQIGNASYYFGFVQGMTKDQILDKFGIDKAHHEEAEKIFMQRMVDDRTFTINALFGAYSEEVAQGKYSAYGHDVARSVLNGGPLYETEPMTEEQFRLIQSYYGRKAETAGDKPGDLDRVLEPYHMTYNDYQILSTWYGRRLAVEAEADKGGQPDGPELSAKPAPPEPPRTDLGGLWRFSWMLLKRGDAGMDKVSQSRDVCMKPGMNADSLPLMPKRGNAKCALTAVAFHTDDIGIQVQCDEGDYGSSWSLDLQPPGRSTDGDRTVWTGELQFLMQNEVIGNLAPSVSTPVTAKRIGDCP